MNDLRGNKEEITNIQDCGLFNYLFFLYPLSLAACDYKNIRVILIHVTTINERI